MDEGLYNLSLGYASKFQWSTPPTINNALISAFLEAQVPGFHVLDVVFFQNRGDGHYGNLIASDRKQSILIACTSACLAGGTFGRSFCIM